MVFPNSMSAVFYIVYVYSEFSHKRLMKNELKYPLISVQRGFVLVF